MARFRQRKQATPDEMPLSPLSEETGLPEGLSAFQEIPLKEKAPAILPTPVQELPPTKPPAPAQPQEPWWPEPPRSSPVPTARPVRRHTQPVQAPPPVAAPAQPTQEKSLPAPVTQKENLPEPVLPEEAPLESVSQGENQTPLSEIEGLSTPLVEIEGLTAPVSAVGPVPSLSGQRVVYDQDKDPIFNTTAQAKQKRKHKHRTRRSHTKPTYKPGARRKWSRGDTVYVTLMAAFALLFFISGGLLAHRLFQDRQAADSFAKLESMILPSTASAGVASGEQGTGEDAEDNAVRFSLLIESNPEFIGWIKIDDTVISYPVMWRAGGNDYYLTHDFDLQYSKYGVPYIEDDCTINSAYRSNNLVIYGHHMRTGGMFTAIVNYRKTDFWQAHPVVQFDTIYGNARYEVVAAFAIDVVKEADFAYNTYLDLNPTEFEWYVGECIRRSLINTGIQPEYGDELLTLSTCEYSTADGRFVVLARRMKETPAPAATAS